jgi:hypothetical protein
MFQYEKRRFQERENLLFLPKKLKLKIKKRR